MIALQIVPMILSRGAISEGCFFSEDGITFGSGLTKAFLAENSIAKYPRIILEKAMINADIRKNNLLSEDEDELLYVNYLRAALCNPSVRVQISKNINDAIQKELDEFSNDSIREKYLWLKKYYEKAVLAVNAPDLN